MLSQGKFRLALGSGWLQETCPSGIECRKSLQWEVASVIKGFPLTKKIDIVLGQKIRLDQLDCGLKIAGSF